jgi:hypothetical protein
VLDFLREGASQATGSAQGLKGAHPGRPGLGGVADPSEHEGQVYETIACVACTRAHLINRSAGRVLGGDDE